VKETKKEKFATILQRFLPKQTVDYVCELIISYEVDFNVTPNRKTKLGDYRAPYQGSNHRISVNGGLNQYSFLITTLHEFAHLTCFIKYQNKVLPHGAEWKKEFIEVFKPIFDLEILPQDVHLAMVNYLKNAKASSCSDDKLYRVLKRYDIKKEGVLVEHLKMGQKFKLKDKIFVKEKKLRKYYLCSDINTLKKYKVLGLAEIDKLIEE